MNKMLDKLSLLGLFFIVFSILFLLQFCIIGSVIFYGKFILAKTILFTLSSLIFITKFVKFHTPKRS